MTWDQIELKWAEMTNRVRADVSMPVRFQGARSPQSGPVRVDAPSDVTKRVPTA